MLFSVQYLRAFAALAVVALHTGWSHTRIGCGGVDVFFVISGFIMMHVSRREGSPGAFLWSRIARIVPLYWAATLLMAAMLASPMQDVALSLSFVPYFNGAMEVRPVLGTGWTLDYEMFFYAVFAGTIALPSARRLQALTVTFGALTAAGLALAPSEAIQQTYTDPIMLEFLAGAWLWRAWSSGRLPKGRAAVVMGMLGVVGMALATMSGELRETRALFWGLPALLIVAGAIGLEASLPRLRGLLMLGNASYALYLIHIPIIELARPSFAPLPWPVAVAALATLCSLAAVAVHLWFERPVSRLISHIGAPRPAAASAA